MQPHPLGNTGLMVSRLGLGLAALGRPGYINLGHADDLDHDYSIAAMQMRAHAALDSAWAAGIRYFDAARSYGRAEEFLGTWLNLRNIAPNLVTVGSKWGYTYMADWQVTVEKHEVKDHSLPVLRRQFAESRALLGAQIDLYQIHSATLDSGVLDDAAVLGELAQMRASGVRVGLSLSGPRQAETLSKAMTVRIDGVPVFDCVQATWNLLEPSAGTALQEARTAGMGVIVKEALANGRLTARNNDPNFAWQRTLLDNEATRLDTTTDALALAGVLAQPWVDVVLSGAVTTEQLTSNVRALQVQWDSEATERLSRLAQAPEQYWSTRARLAWN